ncbi:MAG: ABC transporter ATP-binding protein [Lachnospiraceae bacterium]|nr:ABC transporter ATP-binding protein [Lachnospiraceae bacterium]
MIKAENVVKKFEDFTALNGISCSIPSGCIYGMVGSNGAGKSTFLRLVTGIYRADGGTITIDGEPVYENPSAKGKIAFVPDELYFLPGATMDRMAKLYQAIYPDFDTARYNRLAEAFGLNRGKQVNTFSKGMRRQAATILAISCKPQYLFLDETFDGLDPVMRNLVKGLICQDVAERNATAIITSHSLRELEDTCDQLALLHKGGVILESDIGDLKTSLFKVQIAFREEYGISKFEGMPLLHFSKKGSVANMIARGDREALVAKLKAMNPLLLDVLPLTLEEVFTYEMEALGYAFHDVLEVES